MGHIATPSRALTPMPLAAVHLPSCLLTGLLIISINGLNGANRTSRTFSEHPSPGRRLCKQHDTRTIEPSSFTVYHKTRRLSRTKLSPINDSSDILLLLVDQPQHVLIQAAFQDRKLDQQRFHLPYPMTAILRLRNDARSPIDFSEDDMG